MSSLSKDDHVVALRARLTCVSCRCGWLCCDCYWGCVWCKERRLGCFCSAIAPETPGVRCDVCVDLLPSCRCVNIHRCKWCTVSLQNCTRGGCLRWLPYRHSEEALIYKAIFEKDDGFEDLSLSESESEIEPEVESPQNNEDKSEVGEAEVAQVEYDVIIKTFEKNVGDDNISTSSGVSMDSVVFRLVRNSFKRRAHHKKEMDSVSTESYASSTLSSSSEMSK